MKRDRNTKKYNEDYEEFKTELNNLVKKYLFDKPLHEADVIRELSSIQLIPFTIYAKSNMISNAIIKRYRRKVK